MSKGIIEHRGRVEQVTGEWIVVNILTKSACAHCQLSGSCGLSEAKEKKVEVPAKGYDYKPGDEVNVWFREGLGFRALFLGYVLPFLLMLTLIISVMQYTGDEGLSGLAGLGILFPYYFLVYLNRDKLRKKFRFHISKAGNSAADLKEMHLNTSGMHAKA